MLEVRRSSDRDHAQRGWLDSRHIGNGTALSHEPRVTLVGADDAEAPV